MVSVKVPLVIVILIAATSSGCLDLFKPDSGSEHDECQPSETPSVPTSSLDWDPVGFLPGRVPSDFRDDEALAHPYYGSDVQYNQTPVGNPSDSWILSFEGQFTRPTDPESVTVRYVPLDASMCPQSVPSNFTYDAGTGTFAGNVVVNPATDFPALLRFELEIGSPAEGRWLPYNVGILIERVPNQTQSSINESHWYDPPPPKAGNGTSACPEGNGGFYADPYLMTMRHLSNDCNNPRPLGYDVNVPESKWWKSAPVTRTNE